MLSKDEIIRMAREAGIIFEPMTIDGIEYEYRYVRCSDSIGEDEADCIERFAALVAAHEREKLAKWLSLMDSLDPNDEETVQRYVRKLEKL